MFVIIDDWHIEHFGGFGTLAEAHAELRRIAQIPWDEAPNVCSCMRWRTCERRYHVVEYDTSSIPWKRLSDEPFLRVSAEGICWLSEA